MTLLDTSGLLAALFPDQNRHAESAAALQDATPPLLLSPFVLAELDYLVRRHAGQTAAIELLDEVAAGVYRIAPMTAGDVALARGVIGEYADLGVGLADASIVVLARRHGVADVLTLDERHFRVLRAANARPFRILPADI